MLSPVTLQHHIPLPKNRRLSTAYRGAIRRSGHSGSLPLLKPLFSIPQGLDDAGDQDPVHCVHLPACPHDAPLKRPESLLLFFEEGVRCSTRLQRCEEPHPNPEPGFPARRHILRGMLRLCRCIVAAVKTRVKRQSAAMSSGTGK
ncbi:MAG: hypothetical protein PWR21_1170 [Methanoculleus sp.]|nr:hypothetical protein [Methanoculleus sp.]